MNCIDQWSNDDATIFNGDCCEVIKGIPDESVGLSVYSPPFSNLFIYSDSEADMGNCIDDDEFFEHYSFLIGEHLRITMPGRVSAVHCSDLPTHKGKGEHIGIKDFPGRIIQAHIDAGWIFHSRIIVWKDPVVEMQRTKALGLLHKQVLKDRTMCRVGITDMLLIFRKDGKNPHPVSGPWNPNRYHGDKLGDMETSIDVWQNYASPVWSDIRQGETLNRYISRAEKDERHICPLQLDVICRLVDWYSNPGDVVFSPFTGIGSEGFGSVKLGRRFVGIELKPEYFKRACSNVQKASEAAHCNQFEFVEA